MLRVVCNGQGGFEEAALGGAPGSRARGRKRDQWAFQGLLLGHRGYVGLSHFATKIRQGRRKKKKERNGYVYVTLLGGRILED